MANKAENQWYGKAFEQLFYLIASKKDLFNPYPERIPEKDYFNLIEEARDCVEQFEIREPIYSIEWVGGHTITASGDLIINGTVREFKRVSSGLGTWGNYSINNLYPYAENIPSHIEVMDEYGFLNVLKPYAGEKPRWEKNPFTPNPLNKEEVAELEKNEDSVAKRDELDLIWRSAFAKNVFDYFSKNLTDAQAFVNECVNKQISGKNMPKSLCVYNYVKKELSIYSDNEILEKSEITDIHLNDFGITFGKVRINFAWKNHAGRNLAIYVFLS